MSLTMNFSGLSNPQLLSFGQSLDELLEPQKEPIIQLYDPFKQSLTVCEETSSEAISKQMAQQQTQALSNADVKRDNLFRGAKYLLQAYLLHSDDEKRAAAVELEKVFDKVGWSLNREGYDQQSSLMKILFDELDKKQGDRIRLLGITDYIEDMKTSQFEFDTLRKEQLEQQTEFGKISSMTAERGNLERACKDLLEILPGYYRMTGDEALGATLLKIKELIARTR